MSALAGAFSSDTRPQPPNVASHSEIRISAAVMIDVLP